MEMANGRKVRCILCQKSEETRTTGALSTKNQVTAHQNCLLYSSGIFCRGSPKYDDLFGFSIEDVKDEVKRGNKLICNKCKRKGATAGCEVRKCKKSYHYPCAVQEGAHVIEDTRNGQYLLYCSKHHENQKHPANEHNLTKSGTKRQNRNGVATSSKVYCLTCEKSKGNVGLEGSSNAVMYYCDKHAAPTHEMNTDDDSAAARPSVSRSNSTETRLPLKRCLDFNDRQDVTPSKRMYGAWRGRLSDDNSDSDNEPSEMFAPLESDLEESAKSLLEPQLVREEAETPPGFVSGNKPMEESRDDGEDEDGPVVQERRDDGEDEDEDGLTIQGCLVDSEDEDGLKVQGCRDDGEDEDGLTLQGWRDDDEDEESPDDSADEDGLSAQESLDDSEDEDEESPDDSKDEDETFIQSDAESESLLPPVSPVNEPQTFLTTSTQTPTHPRLDIVKTEKVTKTQDEDSDPLQSPVTSLEPAPGPGQPSAPPSPVRCVVNGMSPCTSSDASPLAMSVGESPRPLCHTPPGNISESPPLLPHTPLPSDTGPNIDSTSFWKSCNTAGYTQAIFSNLIDEMTNISRRIQSEQASQEDYDVALKVMVASGKLSGFVAKQQEELEKKVMELQKALADMKQVVAALR